LWAIDLMKMKIFFEVLSIYNLDILISVKIIPQNQLNTLILLKHEFHNKSNPVMKNNFFISLFIFNKILKLYSNMNNGAKN
jgi:hypothetical protein